MSEKYTIAFYNIENLFDTKDDEHTNDEDFLPTSVKRWTTKRYENKLRKLGQVISQIGEDDIDSPPAIVGLAEVENNQVVKDLIDSKYLKHYKYDIVHYDSSDERGIDVALIYNTDVFEVSHSEAYPVYLTKEDLFDQILISTNFFDTKFTQFNLSEAKIFNSQFLTQYHGKFKGQPFRTYVGKRYKGGYSDHFPVYIEFKEDV